MPKLKNIPGPDFTRIKTFSSDFTDMDLEKRDLITFEKIIKLAANSSLVNLTTMEAAKLLDTISNPLRHAIGCGQKDFAPIFGNASLIITPEAKAA